MLPGDWSSVDSKHSIPGKAHKIDFAQCKRQGRAGQGRAGQGKGRARQGSRKVHAIRDHDRSLCSQNQPAFPVARPPMLSHNNNEQSNCDKASSLVLLLLRTVTKNSI